MNKMKYKLTWKYPFIVKVPKTDLDIIYENYKIAESLMIGAYPIIVVSKIINKFRK